MADDSNRLLQFEFRDYFDVVRRRKWTVIGAVVVVLVTGLFLSLREQKIYRATAEVLLEIQGPTVGSVNANPDLQTEIKLIQSQAVRVRAAKAVPGIGDVSGTPLGRKIIAVSSEDPIPARAVASVNAYVAAYTDYRREQEVTRLLKAAEETQAKVDDLNRQVTDLTNQLEQELTEVQRKYAPSAFETPTQAATRQQTLQREQSAIEDNIKPRRDTFQRQQILLESTLQDLQIRSQRAADEVQVLNPPSEPVEPVRPKPLQDGIKAFATGLVLGILLAFLFEYLDDSIQGRDDVQRAVGDNVPVVGVIPATGDWRDPSLPELIVLTEPKSPTAEAYRSLRTSIQLVGMEEPLTTLAITSASVGEGKTTTLANLAVVIAQSGRRVVILDCDLRRPRVHAFFGLSNEVGFTSVVIGEAPLSMALQHVEGIHNLALLASGPIPPNPSELLTSTRFRDVLRLLRNDGAIVLIDTPPLLPVTDAAVIAGSCDKMLLVVSAGRTTRKQVRSAAELLRQVDAPLGGIVLNRVEGTKRDGYYQYYTGDTGERVGRSDSVNGHALNGAMRQNGNGQLPARSKQSARRRG